MHKNYIQPSLEVVEIVSTNLMIPSSNPPEPVYAPNS